MTKRHEYDKRIKMETKPDLKYTSQFIGAGNTKKEALADAIESLKVIQR